MLVRIVNGSSLIWHCPVCVGLYSRQLVIEILEHYRIHAKCYGMQMKRKSLRIYS